MSRIHMEATLYRACADNNLLAVESYCADNNCSSYVIYQALLICSRLSDPTILNWWLVQYPDIIYFLAGRLCRAALTETDTTINLGLLTTCAAILSPASLTTAALKCTNWNTAAINWCLANICNYDNITDFCEKWQDVDDVQLIQILQLSKPDQSDCIIKYLLRLPSSNYTLSTLQQCIAMIGDRLTANYTYLSRNVTRIGSLDMVQYLLDIHPITDYNEQCLLFTASCHNTIDVIDYVWHLYNLQASINLMDFNNTNIFKILGWQQTGGMIKTAAWTVPHLQWIFHQLPRHRLDDSMVDDIATSIFTNIDTDCFIMATTYLYGTHRPPHYRDLLHSMASYQCALPAIHHWHLVDDDLVLSGYYLQCSVSIETSDYNSDYHTRVAYWRQYLQQVHEMWSLLANKNTLSTLYAYQTVTSLSDMQSHLRVLPDVCANLIRDIVTDTSYHDTCFLFGTGYLVTDVYYDMAEWHQIITDNKLIAYPVTNTSYQYWHTNTDDVLEANIGCYIRQHSAKSARNQSV